MNMPQPQFSEPFPLQPPVESLGERQGLKEHIISYVPKYRADEYHKARGKAATNLLVDHIQLQGEHTQLQDELTTTKTELLTAEKSLEEARIDSVTGLKTAAVFKEELNSVFSRDPNLGVIFIDLNGLKRVNDLKDKHAEGNRYLHESAQAIRRALRPTDEVFRIGGDEFAVYLQNASLEILHLIMERIREEGTKAIEQLNHPFGTFTGLSIGAAIKQEGDDPESLVLRADQHCDEEKAIYKEYVQRTFGIELR